MKIRIHNNFIRLRLNKTDLQIFGSDHVVSNVIDFGTQKLVYELRTDKEIKELSANINGHVISVEVPIDKAEEWVETELVGFENDESETLKILVEKDFHCLHKRPHEDESDSFKNPLA